MKKKPIYEHKVESVELINAQTLSPTPHFHKEVEIIYIKDGSCNAYADKNGVTLNKGDLFISFPNQIHYYENSVFGQYYVIIVNSSIFFELKETLNNFIPINNKFDLSNHQYVADLLDKMLSAEGRYKNTVISGILNYCIGIILPEIELKPKIKTDNSTLQDILDYCTDNFTENITLDTVSDNLHLSKYHISHLLSKKLGISFNSYINMLRVDKARDLLEDTDKKTADISEEVGFGSIRSFNRAFLQIANITPIKYRNRYKMQNNM